jgi:molecular chaperone IbpA
MMTKNLTTLPSHNSLFVGFDDLFREVFGEAAQKASSYPPYNITRYTANNEPDQYEITLALAGFTEDDVQVRVHENQMHISGKSSVLDSTPDGYASAVLHRGIAERSFSRTFKLADHIQVQSATLKDGILRIKLEVELPPEQAPKLIPINV